MRNNRVASGVLEQQTHQSHHPREKLHRNTCSRANLDNVVFIRLQWLMIMTLRPCLHLHAML